MMGKKRDRGKNHTSSSAVVLWLGIMMAYLAAGLLQVYWLNFSLVIWLNLVFVVICFVLVSRREEGIRFLGLAKERFWISCGVGMVCSAAVVLVNGVIPGILSGARLVSVGSMAAKLFYFMIFISIPEEIVFRGYILNTLEQGGKSKHMAIVISGIFFMLIHLPYQAVMNGSVVALLLNGYGVTLVMTFVWHLIFCVIYRKTGAIYGAILFHGIMDWSNYLFVY